VIGFSETGSWPAFWERFGDLDKAGVRQPTSAWNKLQSNIRDYRKEIDKEEVRRAREELEGQFDKHFTTRKGGKGETVMKDNKEIAIRWRREKGRPSIWDQDM
jgi:hypothetical protein